jgi:basic membrane protein A
MRACFAGAVVVVAALVGAGCGDSGSSGSSGSGGAGGAEVKAHWLYTGPKDDGGYNVAMQISETAMGNIDGVETTATYEVPYSQRATQIAEQAVAQGSNVLVETLGLGALMTDVCRQNPDIYCFPTSDAEKQPDNSRSWWPQDWDLNYTAGVAAGLTTQTNEIGLIGSFDIPLIRQAVNTYVLGCQSVNPGCQVRVVYTNTYFDPAKESEAARTLIDSGADVIRNWVDSPAFCQVAEDEGVWAVGEFADFIESCPDSAIVSTIWDLSDYFTQQIKAIQNGEFVGGKLDLIESGDGVGVPHLSAFGAFVSDDVQQQTEEVWAQIVDGEDLVVGPIYDQDGNLMFKEGEAVPHEFMLSKWKWYVQGVIAN